MAKRKTTKTKKKTSKKKPASSARAKKAKPRTVGKPAAKKKAAKKKPVKKKAVKKKKPAASSNARKKKAARPKAAPKAAPSLGRPKVTGEEKLYMLFKDDYHARQIFEYLHVDNLKELEQFSADEIVAQLSKPIRDTVKRIRLQLAEKNRCLSGDAAFAKAIQKK